MNISPFWTKEKTDQLIAGWWAGRTQLALATELERTEGQVAGKIRRLRRAGVRLYSRRRGARPQRLEAA